MFVYGFMSSVILFKSWFLWLRLICFLFFYALVPRSLCFNLSCSLLYFDCAGQLFDKIAEWISFQFKWSMETRLLEIHPRELKFICKSTEWIIFSSGLLFCCLFFQRAVHWLSVETLGDWLLISFLPMNRLIFCDKSKVIYLFGFCFNTFFWVLKFMF